MLPDIPISMEGRLDKGFKNRIRANLSIASYLIKVGKGQSPEMAALISRCGI